MRRRRRRYSFGVRIHSLSLEQFRSYPRVTVPINAGRLHVFLGPNGIGKTNLLEAVSLLSLTRSFQPVDEDDLRQWESGFYRVTADIETDESEKQTLEIVSQAEPRRQKACFVNGVRVATHAMVGQLPTVLFLPQDLGLFSGPPSERRRFLDRVLCQVSPAYFASLTAYERFLKQRNSLLRRIAEGQAKPDDLTPWEEKLAEAGSIVTCARLELLETWGLTFLDEVAKFGEPWDDVKIVYERKGTACEPGALAQELVGLLSATRERDILIQSTTVGPHREDWQVSVAARLLPSFASRGQQRSCLLSLLSLQAAYLGIKRGERPVILLDDVFSELDDRHRKGVLEAFEDHQVLITATEVPKGMKVERVWEVGTGSVM